MIRDEVIERLRRHERELRAAGVAHLAVFGSVARGTDSDESDVDLVLRLTDEASGGGFAYFGRLAALRQRLAAIVGRPVDVIAEPVSQERLRRTIEAESTVAF